MADFSQFLIKDYQYWSVSIHQNQSYLGRCVIWCKREGALDLADALPEERQELFSILKELREALTKTFQPDWFNYAFLGNETRHLHGHFVPRYSSEKIFEDITFTDERWGHNYRTNHDFSIPIAILQKIQSRIKDALG